MKKLLFIPLIFLLVGCSTLRNPTPLEAGIADTVSTQIGLNNGLTEMNPIGFYGATAIKIGLLWYYYDTDDEQTKLIIEQAASSFWTGAAVNNTLNILGASNPVSLIIGLITGIIIWQNADIEKQDTLPIRQSN
jgi:hypothetical protein